MPVVPAMFDKVLHSKPVVKGAWLVLYFRWRSVAPSIRHGSEQYAALLCLLVKSFLQAPHICVKAVFPLARLACPFRVAAGRLYRFASCILLRARFLSIEHVAEQVI